MDGQDLGLELVVCQRVSLATQHSGVPLLSQVTLHNSGEAPLHGLLLAVSVEPNIAQPWSQHIDALAPGETVTLAPDVHLLADALRACRERQPGTLRVSVSSGPDALAQAEEAFEVLAADAWPGVSMLPELLAALVRPGHPALPPLLEAAAAHLTASTGTGADPQRIAETASVLHQLVQGAGVRSAAPAAEDGQQIRDHGELLAGEPGTALDLAVLLCALMEQAGLCPLIVLLQGHALPGVWLTDYTLPAPVSDDPAPLRKRIRLGEALVFDPTAGASFAEAREAADTLLVDTDRFLLTLDVRCARRYGIRPLPLDGAPAPAESLPPLDLDLGVRVDTLTIPVSDGPSRADRLTRWKERLLDLSLRNRLLNFRPSRATVTLEGLDLAALEDRLSEGARLGLSARPALFDADAVLPHAESGRDALAALVTSEQAKDRLLVDLSAAELGKRLLELYRLSRSAVEETGSNALYLGLGMLTWYESPTSEQPRQAPLILLPVTLERASVSTPWSLVLADDESRVNVTLLKKLADEYGLDVSAMSQGPPEDDSGLDVKRIFAWFTHLIRDTPRWDVSWDVAALSPLSFTKFLMWLDLEAKTDSLLRNPVVRHIFSGKGESFPLAAPPVPHDQLDTARPPEEIVSVVSADPTQTQAVLAALDGSSFVLQGPPGTGKSQTITNLIATQLARGKSVLFVSEKRAALEVVHRRLEEVGLGAFCLELHSHKASKKQVMAQLAEALESGQRTDEVPWPAHARRLAEKRTQLNAVAAALRAPSPLGGTVYAALGTLIGLRDAPAIPLPADLLEALSPGHRLEALDAADALARACALSGPPADSPWAAARPTAWRPDWQRAVADTLTETRAALATLHEVTDGLGLPLADADRATLHKLSEVIALLQASPAPPLAALTRPAPPAAVDAALDRVVRRRAAWGRVSGAFTDRLLAQDLDGLRLRFAEWAHRFFLFAWVMLLGARRTLRPYTAAGRLPTSPEIVDYLEKAIEIQRQDAALKDLERPMTEAFSTHWRGAETDPEALRAVQQHAERFRNAVMVLLAALPQDQADAVRERLYRLYTDDNALVRGDSGAGLRALAPALQGLDGAWEALSRRLDLQGLLAGGAGWAVVGGRAAVGAQLQVWTDHLGALRDWTATTRALGALDRLGLAPVSAALWEGRIAPEALRAAVDRGLHALVWEQALSEEVLGQFRGEEHEALIAQYHQLDDEALLLSQQSVAARIRSAIPQVRAPGEEMAILRHQLQLSRRHMPLRKLFRRIPNLLRQLKPCVLMSPLSVARFLDPELPGFDVVVFDEASQIPPWDAIGAIARGDQVIVVGDSKQLPPTAFFHGSGGDDDAIDDEDRFDLDSILEEAVSAGLPQLRLSWHYRSQHEALIAFSNHHYYDGRLHTFPAAAHDVEELGVHLRPVPDGFYDRGRSRTNRQEAEAVCEEIARLLRLPEAQRPTVGVVTFSMPQQRLIEDLLDAMRAEDPALDAAAQGSGREPLFIKNLENVQGDERDVILFSICFGPDRAGRVAMNLGALNKQGGERRLNVAITRARQKVVVFSTMRADQIDLARTRSVGVAHLKTYLAYAQHGFTAIDAAASAPGGETESPFEDEVKAALEADGWVVHPQVGVSGYRIDLAVVDPERPGAYLLAVECDGATWHSSAVARERDRLRQMVLEKLGWTVHRVWSTDWWHSRQRTTDRLLEAVRQAAANKPDPAPEPEPEAPEPEPLEEEGTDALSRMQGVLSQEPTLSASEAPEYTAPSLSAAPAGLDVRAVTSRRPLSAMILKLVNGHGPIEEDHAWQVLREAWGLGRLGTRILGAFSDAIDAIPATKRPRRHDGVLWPAALDPQTWRDFRVPGDARDVQVIPLAEIANAHAWVLSQSGAIGCEPDELCRATLTLLSHQQRGKKVQARLMDAAELLVDTGRARRDGDRIVPAEPPDLD